MTASPRILIIRLSALGDILHALPAFQDLRVSFPNAKIGWLVEKKSAFLLSAVKGIDEVHILDTSVLRKSPFDYAAWRQFGHLMKDLRSRNYDFSLDFQGLIKTAFLSFFSGARTRLGYGRDLVRERPAHWFYNRALMKPDKELHVLTLNRLLAGMAGAHPVPPPLDFIVPEEDSRLVDSLLEEKQLTKFIVLNPGGGWPTKKWPPERFGALAARIQKELAIPVVVTTGPGEEAMYETIAEHSGNPSLPHFQISFLHLIPLLKKASLLVGGDTGPFHLACALGTPVVGIFGPTSPVRNGPWSSADESVAHRLPCSFCYGRTCPAQNECIDISTDEVFDLVIRRLHKNEK